MHRRTQYDALVLFPMFQELICIRKVFDYELRIEDFIVFLIQYKPALWGS
jgi:hypothetical protein